MLIPTYKYCKMLTRRSLTLGECELPQISHGRAEAERSGELTVGRFSCSRGRVLVGPHTLKCRAGTWSDSFPVCTGQYRSQRSADRRSSRSPNPEIERHVRRFISKFTTSTYNSSQKRFCLRENRLKLTKTFSS